jgi:hypothetical protein
MSHVEQILEIFTGQAAYRPGIHFINLGINTIRWTALRDRFHTFDGRLMPPYELAQYLARSVPPNVYVGLTTRSLEVCQPRFHTSFQCCDELVDLLTFRHNKNSFPVTVPNAPRSILAIYRQYTQP